MQRVLNYSQHWEQPLTKHGRSHRTDPFMCATFKFYSNSVFFKSDILSFLQIPSKETQESDIIHTPSAIIICTTHIHLKKRTLKWQRFLIKFFIDLQKWV